MFSFANDRVRLRAINMADAEDYVLWYADTKISRNLSTYGPTSLEFQRNWVSGLAHGGEPIFAVEAIDRPESKHIGNVGFYHVDQRSRQAELGIMIGDRACLGKGYGPAAMRLLLEYGFGELNYHRIYLQVLSFNERAIRSYEKVGFKHEGRRRQSFYREGQYHDDVQMRILRPEWDALVSGAQNPQAEENC